MAIFWPAPGLSSKKEPLVDLDFLQRGLQFIHLWYPNESHIAQKRPCNMLKLGDRIEMWVKFYVIVSLEIMSMHDQSALNRFFQLWFNWLDQLLHYEHSFSLMPVLVKALSFVIALSFCRLEAWAGAAWGIWWEDIVGYKAEKPTCRCLLFYPRRKEAGEYLLCFYFSLTVHVFIS